MKTSISLWVIFSLFTLPLTMAQAKEKKSTDSAVKSETKSEATPSAESQEKINVDAIKEKYWARGSETEMGVVQNRTYSKAKKFEFGLFSGLVISDPWLNVTSLGFSGGYHFNEYFALHLLYIRHFSGPSSALDIFRNKFVGQGDPNTNPPNFFWGGELTASLLYGKLSVLGKLIIYYDMHATAGLGKTHTENGNYLTPFLGIGQQYFLNKLTSLRLDYRLMPYNEDIIEKANPNMPGYNWGSRINWSNQVTLGITFLFGGQKTTNEFNP